MRLDPGLTGLHQNIGLLLADKQDWDGAIAEFRQLLQAEPNNADIHYNLGVALYTKHNFPAAIHEYQEALRLAPKIALFHHGYGVALWQQGRTQEAAKEIRVGWAMSLDSRDTRFNQDYQRTSFDTAANADLGNTCCLA